MNARNNRNWIVTDCYDESLKNVFLVLCISLCVYESGED